MNVAICAGKTDEHIEYRELVDHMGKKCSHGLQPEVWLAFDQLVAVAAKDGIELMLASGFRSFERQVTIWNAKASGERAVLDDAARPIDVDGLSKPQLCEAIMRWSALPGASRHHWGTDFDVYDGAGCEPGYQVQLVPEEFADGGPFSRLGEWLSSEPEEAAKFVRPYSKDRGGIAPEAWHLSYTPLASQYEQAIDEQLLTAAISGCGLLLEDTVLHHLPALYTRFVAPAHA